MRKVIVLLVCLISIVGILLIASKYDKRDFAEQKDHALLYGLKDLVDEKDIEILETVEFFMLISYSGGFQIPINDLTG